jgi:septum formation protein
MLLANAGVAHEATASAVDERAEEAALLAAGAGPDEIALHLAAAKALDVSRARPGDLVLGADQTLGLDGTRFVKAEDRAAAAAQLATLAGRTHALHSALVLAEGGAVTWRHVSVARLAMRPLDSARIERYLDEAGDAVLGSVGCYHLEGPGIRLFEAIEGDYFTILGLPLLPLLARLRETGDLDD